MKSNKYIITVVKENNVEIEDFIWEYGTIFHQFRFLNSVGTDYICYVILDNLSKTLVGVLPLVKTNKFRLKSYHIPPFAYQFGPVFDRDLSSDPNELFHIFYNKIKKNAQLDFKIFIPNQNVTYYKNLNFSVEANQTFIIEKDSDFNLLMIHNSKRRYLKKLISLLEKGDIKIKTDKLCIPDLLEIYKKNADEAGFKSNFKYLEKLIENLNDNQYFIHVLYSKDGQALAGTFCPFDKNTVYYLINASIKNSDKLIKNINILSTYLSIKRAREFNLNFDFEGSNILGIGNYYQMMGGKPKINYRLQNTKSLYYNLLKGINKIL
jgi:antitoxin component of RelBE/YafQ-DinJ toxin-antitoxin module